MLLAVPLGLAIGLIMGTLGGGGAILAVPVLVYLLGQDPHAAAASSLVVVGVGAIAGAVSQYRAGNVRLGQAVVFGLLGVVGNWAGAWLARSVPGDALMVSFAVLLLVVAAVMWRRLRSGRSEGAGARPLREVFASPRDAALLLVTATATGALTGFFGVGGGFMIVPALTLVLGFSVRQAVGSSLVVIALNCLLAFIPRLWEDLALDWPLIAVLTASSVVGSLVGARIARRAPTRRLTQGFIALLLLIAVYTLVQTLWPA